MATADPPRSAAAAAPTLASTLHHELLARVIADGRPPSVHDLAAATESDSEHVRRALGELEEMHGLVLHRGSSEIAAIPPFSLVPTAFWVENGQRGWWASCIWCALGVAALVGAGARIHTRLACEAEAVVIDASGGPLHPAGLVAHFPIPVARAWDDVHRFCGSTLVFRDHEHVVEWCGRHAIELGDVRPLEIVRSLATTWYGGHLARDWRQWTTSEASRIFASLGFTGETWALPAGNERF